MIIVVEGADCAGKSTWVARLSRGLAAQYYDVRTLHAGPPDPDVDILDQYLTPLTQALESDVALVLDRWHLGELVYGPLRRGHSRLSLGQFEYVESVLRSVGYVGVLCDVADPNLLACYDSRGDDLAERTQLCEEAAAFRRLVTGRRDWHVVDTLSLCDEADRTRVELELVKTATPLAPFVRVPVRGAYVGPRWPTVLAVGDRRNPADQHTPLPWPFVPWRDTSGHWMFEALARLGVPLDRVGFINACERTSAELQAAWRSLGLPRVVALGVNASDALGDALVPVTTRMNHPQWWRRFKHREDEAFASRLWYDTVRRSA